MAEQNEDKKPVAAAEDDKSINELLKEYAGDVKDKDFDDFLKGDEEDDVFESDDDKDNDKADEVLPKKSSGLLTGLVMLLAFGAAGAGTYMYLNRDEGMTNIMGGFTNDNKGAEMAMELPPLPEATTPALPAVEPAQTEPSSNPFDTMPTMPVSSMDAPEMEPPVAELTQPEAAMPTPSMPTPSIPEAPVAQPASDVSQAVNAWASGDVAPLPEKAVEEVKAKPVKAAPKAEVKSAPALPKVESSDDAALSPPYKAIQAKNGATASAPAKMAPVVEGASSARNRNEADVTKSTGDVRDMVMSGGGRIETGTKTVAAPAPVQQQSVQQSSAPSMPRLAISGAKSLPPESATQMVAPAMAAVPAEVEMPMVEAPAPVKAMMKAVAPQVENTIPGTASNMAEDAQAMLARAMAAEKAGDVKAAIEMYQRALELDAVYGNGKSIDRGMVYDRIGAIRAAN